MWDGTERRSSDERIAVLEAEVKGLKDDAARVIRMLGDIQSELTRYKGFMGGVMFLATALLAAFSMFKEYIMRQWAQ